MENFHKIFTKLNHHGLKLCKRARGKFKFVMPYNFQVRHMGDCQCLQIGECNLQDPYHEFLI